MTRSNKKQQHRKQRQRQQRKPLSLPKAAAASNNQKTKTKKTIKKGIRFPKNKPTQAYTQNILLEIIEKWRKCEPKQDNGEPPHGSRARIVREYQTVQLVDWLTSNQVKMKWRGMQQDSAKAKAASATAATTTARSPPPQAWSLPGRPVGTTKKAKKHSSRKNLRLFVYV
jgi:hypothetical protein